VATAAATAAIARSLGHPSPLTKCPPGQQVVDVYLGKPHPGRKQFNRDTFKTGSGMAPSRSCLCSNLLKAKHCRGNLAPAASQYHPRRAEQNLRRPDRAAEPMAGFIPRPESPRRRPGCMAEQAMKKGKPLPTSETLSASFALNFPVFSDGPQLLQRAAAA